MRLIYHPDAEAELIEAAQFYERKVSTLGAQFLFNQTVAPVIRMTAVMRECQNAYVIW